MHPQNRVFAGVCVLLMAGLLSSMAGWSSRRSSEVVTAVPLAGQQAIPFGLSLAGTYLTGLSMVEEPLPPAELAALGQFEPFSSLGGESNIMAKVVTIRRAVLDAIDTIGLEDPMLADCLLHLYRNRRLCLAFGGPPGVNAEIREDGSAECGDEAINLYRIPCPTGTNLIRLYEQDMFRLMNTLSHEGLHALQAGYTGALPTTPTLQATWALTNQCREVEAGQQEVARMDAMLDVLDEIIANLALPSAARGLPARVGATLLKDASLTPAEKRQKARDLKSLIHGELRPEAVQTLRCRLVYKQALELFLAGTLTPTNGYNGMIKRTGWFQHTTIRNLGEFRFITALAGGAQFNTDPVPQLEGERQLRQIAARADGTFTDTSFEVAGVSYLTAGYRWGNNLLLAGEDTSSHEGVLRGYLDTNDDGIVEEGTGREVLRMPQFYGGLRIGMHPVSGQPIVFNRSTKKLYELTGSDADGFPTGCADRGGFDSFRDDLLEFRISADANWAAGYADWATPLDKYSVAVEAKYDTGIDKFLPVRLSYRYAETEVNPAVSTYLRAGDDCIMATATPGWMMSAYLRDGANLTEISSAKADADGRLAFHFVQPLAEDDQIVLGITGWGPWSPVYTVSPDMPPALFQPRLTPGNEFQVQAFGMAVNPYTFESSTDFGSWTPTWTWNSSRTGNAFLQHPVMGGQLFWRARLGMKPLIGFDDHYRVAPGVECDFHATFNDWYREGAEFQLTTPATAHPDRFDFNVAGTFKFTALTLESQFNFQYRIVEGGGMSPPVNVRITADYGKLVNPPVTRNPVTDVDEVSVPCLVLSGLNYPVYQFNLANNPADNCVEPHWHSFGLVYPLDTPAVGISDPDPSNCGYGKRVQVPTTNVVVSLADWESFKLAHIPPL